MNWAWWVWLLIVLAGLGLGFLVLSLTPWYKVRLYAMNIKKLYDKHNLQAKAEQVQSLGQNPNANPVLMRKPLRELIATYEALIADLTKMKVPKKARTIHDLSISSAKESLAMYQMAAVGGFRQKAIMDRQKKVQRMQEQLQAEMEKVYGPMKK